MPDRFIWKRIAPALLAVLMLLGSLSGCSQKKDSSLSVFIAVQGGRVQEFLDLYSEKHPDAAFDISGYSGGGPSPYLLQHFEQNDLTDIVITTYLPADELQEATLLDLSGYDFVQSYKASVLSNLDVNGKIYLLEGPSSVRGIAYNKTLFEEKGWKAPESHEEFISLIKQIRAESDLLPLALPGVYSGTYFTLMSELSHCDFLQTPAGAEWSERFAAGDASSEEGFAAGIELLQDWVDAGAFDASQIVNGDQEDYEMLTQRQCAMAYVAGGQAGLVERTEAAEDEFGMFPLYGQGADSEFVATTYGIKIGLSKRLGEPGNEKKLEKALALLELFSTEEGQMVFHTGLGDVLPLSGSTTTLPSMFEQVNEAMERGHAAPFLYPGYEDLLAAAGEYLRDACSYGGDLTGVFGLMDRLRRASLAEQNDYIATVSETLDERQTAQFVANALHAQGYGDFALISMGKYSEHFITSGGANGKLYEGGIDPSEINIPLCSRNQDSAVTLRLTGAQIKTLLEEGRVFKDDEGHTDSFEYLAGGLHIERDKDGRVQSAQLGDMPLEEEKTYTVAFSPGDYSDETAALGNPQDTGVPWQDAYRAYVAGLGTITPEHTK